MIKIGDFARLAQVSVVTLRHYDEIGLLKPVSIDRFTGYRYYAADQLPQLNRILALKDLGFSLAQIERLMQGGVSIEELRGMLLMKHAQAEQRLAEEQGRLSRIAARLKQIELEDSMTPYDVLLKTAPAMYIASQRVTIPTNDQVPEYLTPTIDAVYRHVQNAGGKDAGACFVIWHQSSQVLIDEVAEAAVPLERPIAPSEQVGVYELPATSVASTIHRGDYAGFAQAHAALLSAIEANGWESDGTYREVYLVFDPSDPANHVTEVQYPLRAGR